MIRLLVTCCCLMLTHGFVCAAAVVFYADQGGGLVGFPRPEANDPISALTALAAAPSAAESGQTLASGVLPGTEVLALQTNGDTTTVEFSPAITNGLDDARLTMVLEQVRATLRQFGLEGSIRLQAGGQLLSSYLPPITPFESKPPAEVGASTAKAVGLAGKNITVGPSHGRFWNGSGWYWQRSDPCGFGEAVLEDCNSIRLVQFLNQYLTQDGATVHVPRELNESNCCNSYEGQPWWKMAAYSWLRANGLPCSVWASSSGNCGAENAVSRSSDDIRARPLFADYRGSDIYIAHHSNAGGGGTANGTETFRDTAMENPAHETASYNLALAVNNNVINAIRDMYDSGWANRGVKDAAGGFGEIRIPNRPAILIELGFHDNCTRDGLYLTDNFFRSVAEWGLYKGICEYFGNTPTWDKYSDEFVSHTIPTTMNQGQSYNVSVTFRNRGVVWSEARAFRLGAVGESDPFTGTTRRTISGEVRPGNTYTFNFTMTAPTTPGTYTTDWRMVRDGVAWFGPTLALNVTVTGVAGAPIVTTQPLGQTVNPGQTVNLTVAATGDAPLSYQWRRNAADLSNGGNVSGVTTTGLTITNVQYTNAGTYSVFVSNTNGSVLSANAVLTVVPEPGHPASWGPYNLTTSRSIYSPANQATSLRTGWYTTTAGTGAARSVLKAADANMATMPDAALVSGSTFTVAFTTAGTYSTTADNPLNIYRIGQTWDGNAVWNSPWAAGGNYTSVGTSAQSVVYPADGTLYTFSTGAGHNFPYGIMMKGDNESSITYRKAWFGSGPAPTLRVNYTTPTPSIRSWAYLGWYDQGVAADRQLRIDTDQVAGTYGGVPVTEADMAPEVGGTSYGSSYGVRQWAQGTYTNDLVNLNSSHFYNAVHENAVTYCFVYVNNSKGSSITGAYLGIGSDDGCKVWWNGSVVGSDVVGRGVAADSDFWGPVTINTGWNRLLVKVENGGTGHGVYARFANVNRTELTDSTYLSIYTTDATAPGAPTDLTVAGVTNGVWQNAVAVPTFTWTPGADSQGAGEGVSGVRGQKYYFGGDSNGVPNAFQAGGSYAPGAQADGAYYFKVATVDYALNESSAESFAFLYDGSAPTGVSLGFGAITTDSITVTGSGTDAHSGIGASTGYNYSRTGASDSGAKGATHTWTGLDANTEYSGLLVTVSDQAVPTPNAAASAPQSQWTLSVAPTAESVAADDPTPAYGSTNTWTAVGGFGAGKVQYYRYAFDQSPTHSWTDAEPQWSSGTLATVPVAAGSWYLHVKGYNGAHFGNGSYDYALEVQAPVCSQTNAVVSIADNLDTTFTITFQGTPQAQYYVVAGPDTAGITSWTAVPGSTNSAAAGSGLWSFTLTNSEPQRFYRSAAVYPCP